MAKPTQPTPPPDDEMARYLASLELDQLDLADIEVEGRPLGPWPAVAGAVLAVANAVLLIALPSTALYQLHSAGEGIWVAALLLEPLLLWATGQAAKSWLSGGGQRRRGPTSAGLAEGSGPPDAGSSGPGAAATHDDEADDNELGLAALWAVLQQRQVAAATFMRRSVAPRQRALALWASHHRRALLFCGIVATSLLLGFALPQDAEWAGRTYSGLWFVTVFVALATGIMVGRFIIASGEAPGAPAAQALPPLVLPPWLRWVTLALLIGGALAATFGPAMVSDTGPASGFPFAGVGMLVGITGAIWLARRFDEWETAFAAQAAEKVRQASQRQGPVDADKR